MSLKTVIYVTFFLLLSVSCREYIENDTYIIEQSFYPNGVVKWRKINMDDTGLIESTYYYSSGKIQSRELYRNDTLNGLIEMYYENGHLSEKGNYVNGKVDGHYYVYWENGIIKKYVWFNENGAPYVRYYNEDGSFSSEDGNPFVEFLANKEKTVPLKQRDSLRIDITMAVPPQTQIKLFVGDYDSTSKAEIKNQKEIKLTNGKGYYSRKFDEVGSYDLIGVYGMKDSLSDHFIVHKLDMKDFRVVK